MEISEGTKKQFWLIPVPSYSVALYFFKEYLNSKIRITKWQRKVLSTGAFPSTWSKHIFVLQIKFVKDQRHEKISRSRECCKPPVGPVQGADGGPRAKPLEAQHI